MSMTWPTGAAIVSTLESLIGLGESPDGSNHNKITEWYGIGNGAWCAMTIAYAFDQNGVDLRGVMTEDWAWTPAAVQAAKDKGMWHNGLDGVQIGDSVFYKIPGGDAGIVNHVATWAGNGVTIDGNWGNHVVRVEHDPDLVVGYIRYPFADGPTAPVPVSNPDGPRFPGRYLVYTPGHAMIRGDDVRDWQKRMRARGWTIAVDGIYGPASAKVAEAFQREKGLTADGVVGPLTWGAAWTAPITR
jgi:peptidoglycan hydrolase-like protein with peptidoglycan-binding domain